MNFYERVYCLVRQIPQGKCVSYGQIALLLGSPRAARAVGYALRACREPGRRFRQLRVRPGRTAVSAGGGGRGVYGGGPGGLDAEHVGRTG